MKNYQAMLSAIGFGWLFWAIVWGYLPERVPSTTPESELLSSAMAGVMCLTSLYIINWKTVFKR